MTKKDYIRMSCILKETRNLALGEERKEGRAAVSKALECVAKDCAAWFADENPRFNRARFLAACGLE